MNKPFCVIPFTKTFVLSNGSLRDCCVTTPSVVSQPTDTFVDWWQGDKLNDIRTHMQTGDNFPRCNSCTIQEQLRESSFRLAVNKEEGLVDGSLLPRGWHILFGNVCNLACWTCSEDFSSTIAQHKRRINILPKNFVDPVQTFTSRWPDLKEKIFESYQYHPTITISLLGGEPVYNKHALEFIEHLVTTGLSHNTKIEITTNGTILNSKLIALLDKSNWKYVCVFVSVDAIGSKAEWLRYGCKWETVKQNISHYCDVVNYVEVQTVVSILNINDIPLVEEFCQSRQIPQSINILSTPGFMDIRNWDGDKSMVNYNGHYTNMIGISARPGTKQELKNYIEQFADRTHLSLVDQPLATAIGI